MAGFSMGKLGFFWVNIPTWLDRLPFFPSLAVSNGDVPMGEGWLFIQLGLLLDGTPAWVKRPPFHNPPHNRSMGKLSFFWVESQPGWNDSLFSFPHRFQWRRSQWGKAGYLGNSASSWAGRLPG